MVITSMTKLTVFAFATTILVASAGSAFAATEWNATHPRRAEVNQRLSNQNATINRDRTDGELSRGQARQLHREDHQIRQEERNMASRDGGHITRADQRVLNRQISHDTGRFDQSHPRRAEVNDRLANQDHRINAERRDGEISGSQAAQLHRQDRQIGQEERDMASQNGGHITRSEQGVLNQQENVVSREITQAR